MNTNPLALAIARNIVGAKGGDAPRKAVESPDTLQSIANARIVDLISEGEIEGFASGNDNFLKDIFLDETPIENEDGTRNFKSFNVEARYGTQSQGHIPGFPAVENELGMGVELRQSNPWVRSFSNQSLSAIRVRLAVSSLSKTNQENGDITGHFVGYAIDVATDGGSYVQVLTSGFNGKSSGVYERSHRINLPKSTVSGWTIRVRRLTPDTDSAYIQDTTSVISVTEIIDGKFRYPMSALVGLQIDASQFQAIPTRTYRMKGRRIKVPVNYNPATGVYTGAWNGTFKTAYSNNPAWVFYDLATHPRYGLGHLVSELVIDKASLYAIGQYCDQIVPDGFGGTERRMTCNLYLQKPADAYKVLQDLASVFRGICYWAGGSIVSVADRPTDPVYTYTNSNVIDGRFVYEGTGRRARHTAVIVSYNDMNDFGRLKSDYYDDPEGIARHGYQPTEIVALGCTSRGQAQRVAKWLLLTEKLLTNTVSFGVGINGTFALPGQIVRVADRHRAGKRNGGRIRASATTNVTPDVMPSPAPVPGDTLTVILPTGVSETRTISSVLSGKINVSVPFSALPVVESAWAVESTTLSTQLFRVLAVVRGEDGSHSITCVQHNQSLFDAVDLGEPIEVPNISVISRNTQMRPASVTITSTERAGQVLASSLLTATWPATQGAVRFVVQWRKDGGEWTAPQVVTGLSADYPNAFPGTYEAKVSAVNMRGITSVAQFSAPYVLGDQTKAPGFVAELQDDVTILDAKVETNKLLEEAARAQETIDRINDSAKVLLLSAEDTAQKATIEAAQRVEDILNAKLEVQASIDAESVTRQSEDESLALQIASLSAGSGTQFDSQEIWYFDSTVEGWTSNGTPAIVDGWLRPADHATDPYVVSPDVLGVDGSAYRYVKARIKKVGTPTWDGVLYWQTPADSTWDGARSVTLAEPLFDGSGIVTIDWDNIPWNGSTIDQIRLDLSTDQTATDYYLIDWVAIGRPTPGASIAMVQNLEQALTDADSAEATARQILAAQMRGTYEGSDLNSVTQGFVYEERIARVAADSAMATRTTALEGSVNHPTTGLASKASLTSVQSVTTRMNLAEDDIESLVSDVSLAFAQIGQRALTSALNATNLTVSQQGNTISTHTSQISSLTNTINHPSNGLATKASTAALNAVIQDVEATEDAITAIGSQITQLNQTVAGKASTTQLNALSGRVTVTENSIEALSESVEQVKAEVGGGFQAGLMWNFSKPNSGALPWNGWTAQNGRWSSFSGSSHFFAAAFYTESTNSRIESPPIRLNGARNPIVQALVRRRTPVSWEGHLYWRTANHTWSSDADLHVNNTVPNDSNRVPDTGEWVLIQFDMTNNDDWNSSEITQIRLDFENGDGAATDIRWIGVGSVHGPSGSAEALSSMLVRAGSGGEFAQATVMTNVNGYVAGTRLTNDGEESEFIVLADRFGVVDPNNDGSTVYENGRWITASGGYMRVYGRPFGENNEMIDWYGPVQSNLANCRRSNAINFFTNDGDAYFGGSLTVGTFKNSATSTQISSRAAVETGRFGTNGGRKVVTYSLTYSNVGRMQSSPGDGSLSATVVLQRSYNGGSFTTLQNRAVSGTRTVIDYEPSLGYLVRYSLSGGTTFTDNLGGTGDFNYRVAVTANSGWPITIGSNPGSQRLSITSIEE